MPVLVHQLLLLPGAQLKPELFAGVAQRRAGELPKRLVNRRPLGAAAAAGHQARVINLLVTPQQAQRLAVTGKQLLGQQADAVNVKQRAVGVKQHRTRKLGRAGSIKSVFIHTKTLLDT